MGGPTDRGEGDSLVLLSIQQVSAKKEGAVIFALSFLAPVFNTPIFWKEREREKERVDKKLFAWSNH